MGHRGIWLAAAACVVAGALVAPPGSVQNDAESATSTIVPGYQPSGPHAPRPAPPPPGPVRPAPATQLPQSPPAVPDLVEPAPPPPTVAALSTDEPAPKPKTTKPKPKPAKPAAEPPKPTPPKPPKPEPSKPRPTIPRPTPELPDLDKVIQTTGKGKVLVGKNMPPRTRG